MSGRPVHRGDVMMCVQPSCLKLCYVVPASLQFQRRAWSSREERSASPGLCDLHGRSETSSVDSCCDQRTDVPTLRAVVSRPAEAEEHLSRSASPDWKQPVYKLLGAEQCCRSGRTSEMALRA